MVLPWLSIFRQYGIERSQPSDRQQMKWSDLAERVQVISLQNMVPIDGHAGADIVQETLVQPRIDIPRLI